MKATESRDPITNVPIEQSDIPFYLPGTPSASFVEYVELFIAMLLR